MRIVLCYQTEDRHVQQIAAVASDAEVINASQDSIPEEIMTADIFCGHAKKWPISWDRVVAQGRLQWIQSSAAGMDHCVTPDVVRAPIQVTSASGLFADQVAEQTLALLLGLRRSLPAFFRAAQEKRFDRLPTADLHGTTVGIIGFGGNGRRLAQLLAPFRTRLLATDYFPVDRPDYVEQLLPPDGLREVLRQSDIVILCVPLTDQTRGMIDQAEFQAMKSGATLINVARGAVVVERALVDALESGRLSGAGLDVTEIEPLPETSRLWDQPNVIITPHVGAQSHRRIDDATDLFCDNLRRFIDGRPLRNLIDKQLGFPRRKAVE